MVIRLNLPKFTCVILKNLFVRMASLEGSHIVSNKRITRSGGVKRKIPETTKTLKEEKQNDPKFDSDDSSSNEIPDKVIKKPKKPMKIAEGSTITEKNSAKKTSKKSVKTVKKDPDDPTPKPDNQLKIPEIIIPRNQDVIPRVEGPSPFNGTICYENRVCLGAHISAAGGLENAVTNAVKIGASSFALFLKSQRQWNSKPLEESTVQKFKDACEKHKILPHLILPHGSYLMNLGSHDETLLSKSRAVLLDEMQRCHRLGILYFNIHPGSTCGKISREGSIKNIADSINWVHQQTPGSKVAVVLENMCRQGNTIGGDLSELGAIIRLTFDQSRVGVCIDTCHALAAGYDLLTEEGFQAFLREFQRVVGFKYLVAVHLNDSEGTLDCKRDRHASIGKGHIGKAGGFERIINCRHFRDIPIILETPFISDDTYRDEILLLKSMLQDP